MRYWEEYKQRKYVKCINWGFCLIAVGILQIHILTLVGCILGLCASIRHLVDSKKRIHSLEQTLRELSSSGTQTQ